MHAKRDKNDSIRKEFILHESSEFSEIKEKILSAESDVCLNFKQVESFKEEDINTYSNFFDGLDFFEHNIYFTHLHWNALIHLTNLKIAVGEHFKIESFYIPYASLKTGKIIEKLSTEVNFFDYEGFCFKLDPIEIEDELYSPIVTESEYLHFTNEYRFYCLSQNFKNQKPTLVFNADKELVYYNHKFIDHFNTASVLENQNKPVEEILSFETLPLALKGNIFNFENTFPLIQKVIIKTAELKNEEYIITINNYSLPWENENLFTITFDDSKDLIFGTNDPALKFFGEESDFFRLPTLNQFHARSIVEFSRAKRLKHKTGIVILAIKNYEEITRDLTKSQNTLFTQSIAECLHETIRQSDYVAEYENGEFVFIFPHLNDDAGLNVSMDKCIKALENKTFHFNWLKQNENIHLECFLGGILVDNTDLPVGELEKSFNNFVISEAKKCLDTTIEKEEVKTYRTLTPDLEDSL